MRAVIYTRVSTNEQTEGYSLDAQQEQCARFCAGRGWQVVRVYQDAGRSGLSMHRPALQQMLNDKDYDVIVCHKLDRFSRSLLDVMSQLAALNARGITFASASEQFDFSTPFGKVILAMLAAFAQWYVDNLATEIRKGKQERARQGGWNGTLAFGYTTPKFMREQLASGKLTEQEADTLERALLQYEQADDSDALPCPLSAPGVARAFELYAGGFVSYLQIAGDLNARGYRMRSGSEINEHTVRDILSNRFYLGETHYSGGKGGRGSKTNRQWIPGNHEAIVSEETFMQVEQMRNRRAGKRSTKHLRINHYPLAGLLIDECGIQWRGSFNHNQRYYKRRQQRALQKTCTTAPTAIKAILLESQIEPVLDGLKVPAGWGGQMELPAVDESKLTAKLKRAQRLFVEGDLSIDEYNAIKAEITAQQAKRPVVVSRVELETMSAMLKDVGAIWRIATDEERQQIALALFDRIEIEKGQVVRIHATPVLSHLLFSHNSGALSGKDRNLTILAPQPVLILPYAA